MIVCLLLPQIFWKYLFYMNNIKLTLDITILALDEIIKLVLPSINNSFDIWKWQIRSFYKKKKFDSLRK